MAQAPAHAALDLLSLGSPLLLTLAVAISGAILLAVALARRVRAPQPGVRAHVTALYCFPVKSCAGIALEEAKLDECGIEHDREWVVVRAPTSDDECAQIVTIREYASMVHIVPSFGPGGELKLSTPDGKSITVSQPPGARSIEVLVWRTRCHGLDQGPEAARFLTAFLDCPERPVLLLRMTSPLTRALKACSKYEYVPATMGTDGGGVGRFQDWGQFNLLSAASLRWLNTRVAGGAYTALHFRPNIVVDLEGRSSPFEEDSWERYSVGNVGFQFLKHTGRCMVPTVHPQTAERDRRLEPLITLKRERGGIYDFLPAEHANSETKEAFFAVGARHFFEPGQRLRVGDVVFVSEFRNAKLVPPPRT